MKTFPRLFLLCLGIFLFSQPHQVQAKSPPPSKPLATPVAEPPPLAPEAAPKISPDAPPSASLQPFLDAHLGKILAPPGAPAFAQSELIAGMKASYADGMAAAPEARKAAFQIAQSVCDAMTDAINERQNAVAALQGALATRSSEAAQPRGGGEAVDKARDKDTFFNQSQRNTWMQRAAALRQKISLLVLRERNFERAAGPWPSAPNAPSAAPTVAGATPPLSSPPVEPAKAHFQEQDPVIGQWLLEGRSLITLAADHSITGDRHGAWRLISTTTGKRSYELHWKPPKNWADLVVLSDDGKTLEGKTRNSQPISYFRPQDSAPAIPPSDHAK